MVIKIYNCEITQVMYNIYCMRHEYAIKAIIVNGVEVSKVIIDDHYKEKHSDYMNDRLILKLVQELNGRKELPDDSDGKFSYFATLIEYKTKKYRLVWLLEDSAIYIGVINAFRDRRRK